MKMSRTYLDLFMSDVWAACFLLKCTILQHFINSCLFALSPYLESSSTTPHAAKNIHLEPRLEKKILINELMELQVFAIILHKHTHWGRFYISMGRLSASLCHPELDIFCSVLGSERSILHIAAVIMDGISRATSIWHKLRRVHVGSSRKVD